MAKRVARVRPARKKPHDDDTLLIRSAESLGRVIGSLRRQLLGRPAVAPPSIAQDAKPVSRAKSTKPAARRRASSAGAKKSAARRTKAAPPTRKTRQR